jgi:hypothetical protein
MWRGFYAQNNLAGLEPYHVLVIRIRYHQQYHEQMTSQTSFEVVLICTYPRLRSQCMQNRCRRTSKKYRYNECWQ